MVKTKIDPVSDQMVTLCYHQRPTHSPCQTGCLPSVCNLKLDFLPFAFLEGVDCSPVFSEELSPSDSPLTAGGPLSKKQNRAGYSTETHTKELVILLKHTQNTAGCSTETHKTRLIILLKHTQNTAGCSTETHKTRLVILLNHTQNTAGYSTETHTKHRWLFY